MQLGAPKCNCCDCRTVTADSGRFSNRTAVLVLVGWVVAHESSVPYFDNHALYCWQRILNLNKQVVAYE